MRSLTTVVVLCYLGIVTSNFCYWNTGCPYKFFSSKTPYNLVRGDIRDSAIKLSGCEPVSVWGLIRHGKTYPNTSIKEAVAIKEYVASSCNKGNCSLCAQDIENLRKWGADEGMFNNKQKLTKEGYQDSIGLGRRLIQAFPKLLANLNKDDYIFRPAQGKWIEESIKGFVEGLGQKQLTIQSPKNDFDVIAPYLSCNKHLNDEENIKEVDKYRASSEFLASKDRIKRRLNIDYPLTDENITAIYDLCRYTTSGIDNKFSPWCTLFTNEDLKVLEYIDDLKHYYKNGYGSPTNELFGKFPLTDLLISFQKAKNASGKKLTVYVLREEMLDMVYTALKIFRDDVPLSGSQRKQDRKWRTSKLSTFSSNLIAVLNKCKKDGNDDFNVIFYLNEEPLPMVCKERVCDWKEFEDKLSPFLDISPNSC